MEELFNREGAKMNLSGKDELKPCPFCGGNGKIGEVDDSNEIIGYFIECSICGIQQMRFKKDLILSIEAWNTRANGKKEG